MRKKYVIITAGGSGARMGSSLPKQFIELNGVPVLLHTINKFLDFSPDIYVILVLANYQIDPWEKLCQKYNFYNSIDIVDGGPTRFHSVKNGLRRVPDNALVSIHDGVRPLVTIETITETFAVAEKLGNAIPVVSITETVRTIEGTFNKLINRESVRLVQTPQCFHSELIKEAYFTVPYNASLTDDASVLEQTGRKICLVQGNTDNIKITAPKDIFIAQALLDFKKTSGSSWLK